jgi:hypothetical protein
MAAGGSPYRCAHSTAAAVQAGTVQRPAGTCSTTRFRSASTSSASTSPFIVRADPREHGFAQLVEALLEIADAHALRAHPVAQVSHLRSTP